jgi:sec-independent protein translocase protein TatC
MSDVLEPSAGAVERLPVPARPVDGGPAAVTPQPASPAPDADPSVMSLVDHLAELRKRLFISVLAIVLGAVVGFIVAPDIIRILADPLPEKDGAPYVIQFITLSGSFFNYMKVSFVVGVLIALPVIIYQLWAFVSPGLTEKERRASLPWIPAAITFFLLGTIVAYVTLPYAVQFLTSWTIPDVTAVVPTGEAYYGFVTMIFLLFGAVMEFPIVLVLLAKLGILTVDKLKASRKLVLLGVTIFAVVATPGGDPISPIVMAGTMYVLYEFTIWLLARGERSREALA